LIGEGEREGSAPDWSKTAHPIYGHDEVNGRGSWEKNQLCESLEDVHKKKIRFRKKRELKDKSVTRHWIGAVE